MDPYEQSLPLYRFYNALIALKWAFDFEAENVFRIKSCEPWPGIWTTGDTPVGLLVSGMSFKFELNPWALTIQMTNLTGPAILQKELWLAGLRDWEFSFGGDRTRYRLESPESCSRGYSVTAADGSMEVITSMTWKTLGNIIVVMPDRDPEDLACMLCGRPVEYESILFGREVCQACVEKDHSEFGGGGEDDGDDADEPFDSDLRDSYGNTIYCQSCNDRLSIEVRMSGRDICFDCYSEAMD
jgi:hypothetical protein